MPLTAYPLLDERFALRQIGPGVRYLMNYMTGEYYELEEPQLAALRLCDGTRTVARIAAEVGVSPGDADAFITAQAEDGVVALHDGAQPAEAPYYRYCDPPHLSDVLIEVTGRCNLTCAHCFNSDFNTDAALSRQMTTDQILALIADLDAHNVRRIQISGGEPTMRKDLWTIIDAIDRHRMYLDVISTNATLLNERLAERLSRRFKENGALYISMDGLTADTYEAVRGEGVFPGFQRAMERLDAHGCRVFINTMAVRTNLHQMDQLYDWMASHPSIKGWRIGLPKVLGRYREFHDTLEVEFEEVILVFKRLLMRWLTDRPGFRMELSDFFRTDSFDSGLEDHRPDDHPCKYALTNMTIKPDGTAVFCASLEVHPPAVLGNVAVSGVGPVWHGRPHMAMREMAIRDLPDCGPCRYSRLCGGGCRSNALLSYGDIRARDPRACEAMRMLEAEIIPDLHPDLQDRITALIDHGRPFAPATGFRRFI
ncbi:radical SAM protein with 4Fe4S-binding SPASM domain [Azospirillum fermentarium]|uniref:radical SAM/SPASM domain-containing protein n=1 Tax=Azospirillum fermentarium TaxID=1233114 RepID=UPI00222782E2|nr:radical SAM protein [Azospirillum fermentarium]MCW2247713.1 radical SAM protein with 4Fe4S-binding SPASM domain [Azospirillum fermentarium]